MAFVNWQTRSKRHWTPANYNANEADTAIIPVGIGDVVQACFCRIGEDFDETSAAIVVGDGSDPDGYMDSGDITEATAGLYGPGDGAYIKDGLTLYTSADCISVGWNITSGAGSGDGWADFWIWVAKADPH